MPERRETSSRPLASTTEHQPQQPEGVSTSTVATPQEQRRKRSTTLSNGTAAETKSMSSRRRSENTKTLNTEFDADSSRIAQRSTTSLNNMPTVSYTKTGRVSKAKKGLKIHDCECGRSYTRAEHLRRHQRNHAQEGTMICKYPNCGKPFYRADLLQRHEERHNELGGSISRQPSISSNEYSAQPPAMTVPASFPMISTSTLPVVSYVPQQAMSPQPELSILSRYNPNQFRTPQLPHTPKVTPSKTSKHLFQSNPAFKTPSNESKRQSLTYSTRHSNSGPVLVDGMTANVAWGPDPFAHSPYSCSSGYASPAPGSEFGHMYATPPYSTGVVRTRASSNASFIEQTWAHSSRSPTSSISMPYFWPTDEKNIIASRFPYTPVSYTTSNMPMHASSGAMAHYGQYEPHNLVQMDRDELAYLSQAENYGMSLFTHTLLSEHFLNNYWRLFHPTFPIVHRFTLASLKTSPMLYAAMIAIGAHYSNNTELARKLHERCVKLLELRGQSNMLGCDRLCDYQAVFLVEVFAQYCAGRCARGFSSQFSNIFEELAGLPSVNPSTLTEPILHAPMYVKHNQDRWLQWVNLSVKQRVLLACYILDFQQSALLGRDRNLSVPGLLGDDIPFPSHESLWEATDAAEWYAIAQRYSLMPTRVSEAIDIEVAGLYDSFQSSVLIAAHYSLSAATTHHVSLSIERLIDESPSTRQKLLCAKLARIAPVRALLAVSGESWVLGTKVISELEYTALQDTLQAFMSQLWSIPTDLLEPTAEALRISIEVLRSSFEAHEPLRIDMGGEVGLYIAASLLWAATTATSTRDLATRALPRPIAVTTPLPKIMIATPRLHQRASQSQTPYPCRKSSVPQSEIEIRTLRFFNYAMADIQTLNAVACQTGCTSLLLWLKKRLRSEFLNNKGDPALGMSSSENVYSGLVMTILDHIEKMLKRGREGWGI